MSLEKREEKSGLFQRAGAMFSSKNKSYGTPKKLFDQLNQEFNFILDPATTSDNPLRTKYFYSNEENGLVRTWDLGGSVFINPPYGKEIFKWVEKGAAESAINNVTVVMLLPARTDTQWFRNHIWNLEHNQARQNVEVRFIKGRIRFESEGELPNVAPFPSMIVIFKSQLPNLNQHQQQSQQRQVQQRQQTKDRTEQRGLIKLNDFF